MSLPANLPVPPSDFVPYENIVRRLLSSSDFNRSGRIMESAFGGVTNDDKTVLSVDRFDHAPLRFLEQLGKQDAQARTAKEGNLRTFYGWAILPIDSARESERNCETDPLPDENPYHAQISWPTDSTDDEDSPREHSSELAIASKLIIVRKPPVS